MILILSCSFLLSALLSSRFVGRKIFGGEGAKETPRPKNGTNMPLTVLSIRGLEGELGMHPGLTSR